MFGRFLGLWGYSFVKPFLTDRRGRRSLQLYCLPLYCLPRGVCLLRCGEEVVYEGVLEAAEGGGVAVTDFYSVDLADTYAKTAGT